MYRACPKHTKLLVSKAIVQAVEEQSGRFLERSRKTGLWYIVPYKRAVDKTSQGLRERDKDEPEGPPITSLPASLRAPNGGKLTKPNLSELAGLTMAHAGLPNLHAKPPPPPSVVPKMAQQAKQKKQQLIQQQRQQQQQQQQQMQQQQMAQQQMQQQQQQQQMQQQSQQQHRGSFFSMGSMGNSSQNEPLDAPQPGLLASQSSMFRILSRFGGGGGNDNRRQSFNNNVAPPGAVPSMTSMSGPGITAFMGMNSGVVNNNTMNNNNMNAMTMNNNSNNMNNMNSLDMANNMNNMNSNMNNPNMIGPMNNNNNMNNMNMNNMGGGMNNMGGGMNNAMNQQQQGNNANSFPTNQQQFQQQVRMQQQAQQSRQQQQQQQSTGAPALTRLTTQVSDWLTSFWPVNKGEDPNKQRQQRNNMGQGMNVNNSMQNQMMQQNQMMMGGGNGGGMNNMMGPPSGVGISNINNNNMPMPSQLSSEQLNNVMDAPRVSSRRASVDIPPPARLESSVSTTLLKLASSPSKMLAGISTFFSNTSSGFVDGNPGEPNPLREDALPAPPAGLGRPMGRRPSNRSSDLLDDYEETELEARMRAVAGGS